jgi:hypothetical protein
MLVHVAIQMKMDLIAEPNALEYSCTVLQKHRHRRQLSWLYRPQEGLAAFEFWIETSTHLLELSCMLMMLPS